METDTDTLATSPMQLTEVGLIPEDWALISYEDAFDFLSTATYARAELSETGEYGYVHYGDIHTKWVHFLDLSKTTLPKITAEKVKSYALLKEGDLVMADASEDYEGVGESVEVINLGSNKAISGLHTFLLRDKQSIFSPGYKAYLHKIKPVKSQMDKLATGLKVYGVSKANLKIIQIPLPPTKAEQTAIATALGDADALIERLEQLIAKKRLIKQGAMRELLTPPGLNHGLNGLGDDTDGAGEAQQEIRAIRQSVPISDSDNWEVKTLGEVADIDKDNLDSSTDPNYSFKYIALEDVSYGTLKNTTEMTFKDAPSRARRRVKKDDVLISTVRPNLKSHLLVDSKVKNLVCSTGFSLVTCKRDVLLPKYLFHHLFADFINNQIEAVIAGSNYPAINSKDVKSLTLPIPKEVRIQEQIAQILSDMDTEIERLEAQLAKWRRVKEGMMQCLLTGQRRLIIGITD